MASLAIGANSPSSVSFSVKPTNATGPNAFSPSIGTTTQGTSMSFRPGGGSLSIQTATSQNFSGFTPSAPASIPGASQLRLPGTGIGAQTEAEAGVGRFQSITPEQVDRSLGKPTSATKSDGTGAGGSSGGGEGGQREVECSYCNGEMLTKKSGRLFQRLAGWLQRSFSIKLPSVLLQYLKEKMPVEKYDILKGECEACRNKRTIPDPTDDRSRWAEATANFQAAAPEIEQLEAKLAAPGGNRYTIIQGSDILEVGLGMNDVPSYRVDKECMVRNSRLTDLGNKETDPKKGGPIPKGARMNHVQGTNPPASPGGHYVIKCSNKFSIVTGAQGIDITTGGPITINGGITQITGPEVTIGTQTGRLALEGEVVSVGGKSIEMAPTDGQVFVKGTLGTTGNMMCGGHAHMESASVVKLETTGKNQESNISAPNNTYGGPAFWGSIAGEGIIASLREMASYVLFNTTNPEHAKNVISLRYVMGLADNLQNIAYNLRFIEFVPTGICIVPYGSSAGLHFIFNFPHVHAMPDQMHTHETRVPDIKADADSAEQLRGENGGVAGPAPLHKTSTKLTDVLVEFWGAISTVFIAPATALQHFVYRK